MNSDKTSASARLLGLLKRLRELRLEHCPEFGGVISPAQMILLEQIAAHPGTGIQDIADQLNLRSPTVSVGVSKLEESGVVERRSHPKDGRSVQLFMTQQGQSIFEEFQAARQHKLHLLLAGLDPGEQAVFLKLLRRALNYAEKQNKSDGLAEQ
jgi:DNA-binding MarR family transcriptional regulator